MGRLYLHIGTPKTGTSMIQYFMARNHSLLLKKGYSYPNFGFEFSGIGRNRNAHFLTYEYHDEAGNRLFDREKKLQAKGFEKLLRQLEHNENVVISDEHIWTGYSSMENFWENLKGKIIGAGHELKVIVYLRRQDAYVQSYWAQQVKEAAKISFSKYIEKKRYQKSRLNYQEELEQLEAVLGRENMIVRVYEKGQYYGGKGNLIEDFLHAIGLELTEEYAGTKSIINGSVSGEYLEIKRILNRSSEFSGKENFLLPIMQKISEQEKKSPDYSRAACFAEDQKAEFLEQFEEGNQVVAKKYLNKENGILFEEAALENADKTYTKEELVIACGEIILELKQELEEARSGLGHRIYKEGKNIAKKVMRR